MQLIFLLKLIFSSDTFSPPLALQLIAELKTLGKYCNLSLISKDFAKIENSLISTLLIEEENNDSSEISQSTKELICNWISAYTSVISQTDQIDEAKKELEPGCDKDQIESEMREKYAKSLQEPSAEAETVENPTLSQTEDEFYKDTPDDLEKIIVIMSIFQQKVGANT
ncbi:hypothetical protein NUSPORA_01351 [Nucleospora cyclopteri]